MISFALVNVAAESIFRPVAKDIETLNDRLLNQVSPDSHSLCSILQNIFSAGGKKLRPAVSFLVFRALKFSKKPIYDNAEDRLLLIAEIAELIHTASLVHDDIIDNSLIRRGAPTTNSKWDNAVTVISGDFMFARAAVNLAKVEINKVVEIFAIVLENLCSGEIRQVEQKYNTETSWDYYLMKTYNKTASLFEASAKAVTELFDLKPMEVRAITTYGKNIGMAFQIIDDILDLTSDEETLGKPAGADIREGQINIPLLYAFDTLQYQDPERLAFIKSRIKAIPSGALDVSIDATVKESIKICHETGAIDKSYERAADYIKEATDSLSFLGDSAYKDSLIKLADFVVNRTK